MAVGESIWSGIGFGGNMGNLEELSIKLI